MLRTIAILAVLCTGLALGALVVAIARSNTNAPQSGLQPAIDIPALDPAVAAAEIAELHQARGSVLAGTSLASFESPDNFNSALAEQTGVELPAESSQGDLVDRLRSAAHDYDDQAHRLEEQERYVEADELRRLGEETRRVARLLAKEELR